MMPQLRLDGDVPRPANRSLPYMPQSLKSSQPRCEAPWTPWVMGPAVSLWSAPLAGVGARPGIFEGRDKRMQGILAAVGPGGDFTRCDVLLETYEAPASG